MQLSTQQANVSIILPYYISVRGGKEIIAVDNESDKAAIDQLFDTVKMDPRFFDVIVRRYCSVKQREN